MQYCVSRDTALRGGASAVLRITGQCPEGGPVQYSVSRANALRWGQCSIVYHGTMP